MVVTQSKVFIMAVGSTLSVPGYVCVGTTNGAGGISHAITFSPNYGTAVNHGLSGGGTMGSRQKGAELISKLWLIIYL